VAGSRPPLRLPPADLASRAPLWFPQPACLWRYHRVGLEPLHFGRSGAHRFDAPDDARDAYGVCYCGLSLAAAFAETFLRDEPAIVHAADLRVRRCAQFVPAADLRLVRFEGPGLRRLGADAASVQAERAATQSWSAALWRHPSRPHGLVWRARHDDGELCAALFDPLADGQPGAVDFHREAEVDLLGDPNLLGDLLDRYGAGFEPD
jgi:hypothetical protein